MQYIRLCYHLTHFSLEDFENTRVHLITIMKSLIEIISHCVGLV